MLHFTLILLSVKQGGIKYHFWSIWYDSTWDWTQVSQAIGKHSNHRANPKGLCPKVSVMVQQEFELAY